MRRRTVLAAIGLESAVAAAFPLAAADTDAPAGRIVAAAGGGVLDPAALVERIAASRIVLLGELHDAPEHHRIERWLLASLHARRPQGSVVMEMYGADAQPRLSRFGAWMGKGGDARPQTVRDRSGWNPRWDWGAYGPFVTQAMRAGIPILAGNLSAREDARLREPMPGDAAADGSAGSDGMLAGMHGSDTSPAQLAVMARIQKARDRRMATLVQEAPGPVMLVAGRFHVLRGVGVPAHLTPDAADAASVVVLGLEGEEVAPGDADYVWYVPR